MKSVSKDEFLRLSRRVSEGGGEAAASECAAQEINRNYLINGGFDIWQRGTSQTSSGYSSDDRWNNANSGSTKTHSRQAFTAGQTDVPNNPMYYSRTIAASSAGVSNYVLKTQRIEEVSTFSGESVTLSFWAKADAAKDMAISFKQNFGSGGSAQVAGIGAQKVSLSVSWQKFEITVSIPSISGKTVGANSCLALYFWFDAGSDYNARTDSLGQQSGTFDVAQCKVEKGSAATDFLSREFAQELILCERYYEKTYAYNTNPGTATAIGSSYEPLTRNSTAYTPGIRYQVEKRIVPTVTLYSTSTGASGKIKNGGDKTAVAGDKSVNGFGWVQITSGVSSSAAYIQAAMDAEL